MMGNIIFITEKAAVVGDLQPTILKHFPSVQAQIVKPVNVLGALLLNKISLLIYLVPKDKEIDCKVISEVRSVTDRVPLLIYGYFEQMNFDIVTILNHGVQGLLSANSKPDLQIKAIETLLGGGSYIDATVKFQALANFLRH